ncbi:MAG TPA: type II secretion system protein, partial [Tepidisphaeraceae bacterium]|nr:type II secretion system protein [Tepidisphaeraceae bacterium]
MRKRVAFNLNPTGPRADSGFTLVELLVVIGVISLLVSLLLPALGKAKQGANRAFCLNNLRTMQMAQLQYANDNRGYLVQAGLSHQGVALEAGVAWINTLQRYYRGSNVESDTLANPSISVRCPSDVSPHWVDGVPVPQTNPPSFRRTSYGINIFLDREMCPWGPRQSLDAPAGGWYAKITRVRKPSSTIQFVEMA